MICGRGQVNNELLPIARHLKEMTESNKDYSHFAVFIAPKIFEDSKRYARFIRIDEGLDIRNVDILAFIERLKIASVESNSINETFNLEI